MRYLTGVHEGLISDLGGEVGLSAAKTVLVDRVISLLGVIRSVEEHFKDDIMTPSGDLRPALSKSYLAYNNTLRLTLMSLGLERLSEPLLTATDLIAAADREQEREEERTTRDAETQERA